MRKTDLWKEIRIAQKREKKHIKRKRKNRRYAGTNSVYEQIKQYRLIKDRKIIKNFSFNLYEFLIVKDFLTGQESKKNEISIPKDFSFESNYQESLETIKEILESIVNNIGNTLKITFLKCKKVDQGCLFFLYTLLADFKEKLSRLDGSLRVLSAGVTIEIQPSADHSVNKILFVNKLLQRTDLPIEGLMPRRGMANLKGSKSQILYQENRKGKMATRIREFLDECLSDHQYELNADGKNEMDGLLSEILNNCEDHSEIDAYYTTANSFMEFVQRDNNDVVGEVNICFLNFGYSIFEGLEQTKIQNQHIYRQIDNLYQKVKNAADKKGLTRENLFTLYALQDGISRLKYENASRGTGTMKFINSFFALGGFEDPQKHYHPELTIISGSTSVTCTNTYCPFEKNHLYYLSLNQEKDLEKPPDSSQLKSLKSPFPGTLVCIKIYLNKSHLNKK